MGQLLLNPIPQKVTPPFCNSEVSTPGACPLYLELDPLYLELDPLYLELAPIPEA